MWNFFTHDVKTLEDKSIVMPLLGIKKAFDSVWHDALRHNVKIISSFLYDRVSYVSYRFD